MTAPGTVTADPLAVLEEIRGLLAARDALVERMASTAVSVGEWNAATDRLAERVPTLLAGYDALLGVARECEQKQLRLAEWRNRAQILGASVADMAVQSALASAYGEAAAKIRSAIAAALFAEESAS